MLLEMHCHTAEHSRCSHVNASELIRRIYARGLDGIVLTDHHYLWSGNELQALRALSGVPEHFLIFSGQEVTTSDVGDVLVLGAESAIAMGLTLSEVRMRSAGAALMWAHPFRNGNKPRLEQLLDPRFDGVEIFSTNHSISENTRGLNAWHAHKFTAVAGTDTHGASYAGNYPTLFDHPVETLQDLVEEIKKGRCRPYLKETIRAGTHLKVTELAIGDDTGTAIRERVILKAFPDNLEWKSAERTFHLMTAIFNAGFDKGTYRIARPLGCDAEEMLVIEQGLQGTRFFEKLIGSSISEARCFTRLSARWLAKLHNQKFQITPPGEFLETEPGYLDTYLKWFENSGHPHTHRVREIADAVRSAESRRYRDRETALVQGHGDYHPKNIYICKDRQDRPDTLYVAAIDFDSSRCLPPAFDVGTFLAQFRHQFFSYPAIRDAVPQEVFLDAYLESSAVTGRDFLCEVELFHARANLNIAAYLVQLGLGDSEDLWRLIVEAERAVVQHNA